MSRQGYIASCPDSRQSQGGWKTTQVISESICDEYGKSHFEVSLHCHDIAVISVFTTRLCLCDGLVYRYFLFPIPFFRLPYQR